MITTNWQPHILSCWRHHHRYWSGDISGVLEIMRVYLSPPWGAVYCYSHRFLKRHLVGIMFGIHTFLQQFSSCISVSNCNSTLMLGWMIVKGCLLQSSHGCGACNQTLIIVSNESRLCIAHSHLWSKSSIVWRMTIYQESPLWLCFCPFSFSIHFLFTFSLYFIHPR